MTGEPGGAPEEAELFRQGAPLLFADRGCPFAHRVLALLAHLDLPVCRRECRLGERPAGVHRYSARGAIPLLVHGELVLTESRVMLEHLAERHGWHGGLPPDLAGRTLHRHAMAVVDDTFAPWLLAGTEPEPGRLEDACRALEAAIATTPPVPSLLALHVAPIWARYPRWRPEGAVRRFVAGRPALVAWLDAVAELPCVRATLPDPVTLDADLALARAAGLVTEPASRPHGG